MPQWSDLLQRESARVDWKRGGDPLKVAKTLCAFANDFQQMGGGYVICGLEETQDEAGHPTPVAVGLTAPKIKQIRDKVFQHCSGNTRPPIGPSCEEFALEDSEQRLLVFFQERSRSAHQFKEKGQYFYPIRIHDRVIAANGQVPRLLEQKGRLPLFLEQINQTATLSDLEKQLIEEDLDTLRLNGRPEELLQPGRAFGLGIPPLIEEHNGVRRPTNLALILFGRQPELFIPGSRVIFTVYEGNDTTAAQSDIRFLSGSLSVVLATTLRLLAPYIGIVVDKSRSFGAQNTPRFPRRAIEEGIVNALAHRDYSLPHPTRVTLFQDRLEISSPGGLLWPMDTTRFKNGTSGPRWRNDTLALYMVHKGHAQYQGQGIPTIIKETREVTNQEAEFLLDQETVTIRIPAVPTRRSAVKTGAVGTNPGLLIISIGAPSILNQVTSSLPHLGLANAATALEYTYPRFLPPEDPSWDEMLSQLKQQIRTVTDQPEFSDFHLFLRGPVVAAVLIGALLGPHRRLSIYSYENGQYRFNHTIDKTFLKS